MAKANKKTQPATAGATSGNLDKTASELAEDQPGQTPQAQREARLKGAASPETEKDHGVAEPEPIKRRIRLNSQDMQLTEGQQSMYTATPPAGTTREDVLDPSFWTHVATRVRPMTEVTVIPKDGAWYGKYFVRYADRTSARVAELMYQKLEVVTAADIDNDMFGVDFTTGQQFFVFRKADKTVLQESFQNKEDAVQWMHDHMKAMAA